MLLAFPYGSILTDLDLEVFMVFGVSRPLKTPLEIFVRHKSSTRLYLRLERDVSYNITRKKVAASFRP